MRNVSSSWVSEHPRARRAPRDEGLTDPEPRDGVVSPSSGALLELARCRELLGDEAAHVPDDEIDRVRRHAAAMAHVLIIAFLENRLD